MIQVASISVIIFIGLKELATSMDPTAESGLEYHNAQHFEPLKCVCMKC